MQKRRISRRGPEVSRIGLGSVTFGGEIDEAQSFGVLDYASGHGISLLDTAEGCGGGQAQAYRRSRGIVEPAEPAAQVHSSEKIVAARPGSGTRLRREELCRLRVGAANENRVQLSRRHLPDGLDAQVARLESAQASYDPGTPAEEAMTAMSQGIAY